MVIRSVFCEVSFDGIFPLSSRSYFMGVWSFLCASVQVRLCVWVCNCVSVSQRWHCSWQKYVPGLGLRWLWFVSDQGWHTGQHSNTQLLSLSWFSTISLWFVIPSPLSLSLQTHKQLEALSIFRNIDREQHGGPIAFAFSHLMQKAGVGFLWSCLHWSRMHLECTYSKHCFTWKGLLVNTRPGTSRFKACTFEKAVERMRTKWWLKQMNWLCGLLSDESCPRIRQVSSLKGPRWLRWRDTLQLAVFYLHREQVLKYGAWCIGTACFYKPNRDDLSYS